MKHLLPLLLVACATPASVERVKILSGQQGWREGTAVLVKNTPDASYWATNAHVVEDASPQQAAVGTLSVLTIWGVTGGGEWDDLYYVVDGAILETRPVTVPETEELLGRWVPAPGEEVSIHTTRGVLSAVMRPHAGTYQFAVLGGEGIIPGDSGSPVYAQGKLVGLVWASSDTRDHVGVLTPLWAIREALSDYRMRWVLE